MKHKKNKGGVPKEKTVFIEKCIKKGEK